MKKINLRTIHILIIILGILFILIPNFHTNLWFDESYSVAISNNHNFGEIWEIGGHDVHPVLYYWMLKIISLIFGNNILCYRLLSVIALAILGILGYTHIRKDFGEKTGALFSLFTFVFPLNLVYSGEIRMYTWAMLFVAIMAIYAYRIFKGKSTIKNWIIFGIFSLASAYTHYYGLMTAGVINILLFIWILKNAIKEKKFTKNLKIFIVQAIIQIILYLPWVLSLLLQVSQVSKGFWVGVKFPDTLIELFTFQFTGNLLSSIHISNWIAGIYGLIICIYIIYIICKNKKSENKISLKPARYAIITYFLVILGAIAVSIIIWRPIIYARYLLVITGLLIFAITYTMSKIGNKKLNICIIILSVIISTYLNINLSQINYDKTNQEPINYVKENMQEGDIIIYKNDGTGFVLSANFPQCMQYFYDKQNWRVEEAYKAFGTNMTYVYNLDFLKDYEGRIWIIDMGNYELYEQTKQEYEKINLIKQVNFDTKYQTYRYNLSLVEKIS